MIQRNIRVKSFEQNDSGRLEYKSGDCSAASIKEEFSNSMISAKEARPSNASSMLPQAVKKDA